MSQSIFCELPIVGTEKKAKISAIDFEKCEKIKWYEDKSQSPNYPYNMSYGRLHLFIMNPRPDDIDPLFVVDHKDRDPFNASRENLRFVSLSFNAYNRASPVNQFKGTYFNPKTLKWRAKFRDNILGYFDTEKKAGYRVMAEAINHYGIWAIESTIFTDNFSAEEMQAAQNEHFEIIPKIKKILPKGVTFYGDKYIAKYKKQCLGKFSTEKEALDCYQKAKQINLENEHKLHFELPITRNESGQAYIQVKDIQTIVDDDLWHTLTYNTSWNLNNAKYVVGYVADKHTPLHKAILKLRQIEPDLSRTRENQTVDHINRDKHDNRTQNLRWATNAEQTHNQTNKKELRGIHKVKGCELWRAELCKDGFKYRLGSFDTAEKAALAFDFKAKELFGSYACLNFPDNQDEQAPDIYSRPNLSGYTGVYFDSELGSYQATLTHEKKSLHLGYFETAEQAARAYDWHRFEKLGNKSYGFNFPEEVLNHDSSKPPVKKPKPVIIGESGFKGVSWEESKKRWRSTVYCNGKRNHAGYHREVLDAARAYDAMALSLLGPETYLNFPETE